MGPTNRLLDDVRAQIAPADDTLSAARGRRDDTLNAAKKFEGALRTYNSGSIGHGTANDDTDADCGVVLDRRSHPSLGPDGDGEGPSDIMERVRGLVRDQLLATYPNLTTRLSKRAIILKFDQPVGTDEDAPDPSVDLIVALTRKDAPGLWIPNRDNESWDASHPERHTELLADPPAEIRRVRARTVRLAKAWNKQYRSPGLSSFNIEALALECVTEALSIGEAVTTWFEHAASEIERADTGDPAGVSLPIRLLEDREIVVSRLQTAAGHMRTALDNDDDEGVVTEELAAVFWKYIDKPAGEQSKATMASALRSGNSAFNKAGQYAAGAAVSTLKTTRSFGDGNAR